jgi:hypothetical protein
MYSRRLITIGTLLAVLLATSDEAIPVLLAQPEKGDIVVRLLITKLIIGLTAGYVIDFILGSYRKKGVRPGSVAEVDEHGCCNHDLFEKEGKWQWLKHPLIHTAKVFAFIVAVTFGINFLIALVGEEHLGMVLMRDSLLQPFLSAMVGLIPNCAASVAIAEMFLKGGLSYGSAIAGLCTSGGLGLLVLFKENRSLGDTMRVLVLLVGIGTIVGTAIQFVYG